MGLLMASGVRRLTGLDTGVLESVIKSSGYDLNGKVGVSIYHIIFGFSFFACISLSCFLNFFILRLWFDLEKKMVGLPGVYGYGMEHGTIWRSERPQHCGGRSFFFVFL